MKELAGLEVDRQGRSPQSLQPSAQKPVLLELAVAIPAVATAAASVVVAQKVHCQVG
jgi:hypothetical protein